MNFRFSSLQQVIDVFANKDALSPDEISQKLGKSKVIVHRYLKELVKLGKLEKQGLGAHVRYVIAGREIGTHKAKSEIADLSYEQGKILDESFYKYAENGRILKGTEGFIQRCHMRKLDVEEKAKHYIKIKKHIDGIRNKCDLIKGTETFEKSVDNMSLDDVYYGDQYNRMEFGRGKLAEMTFYAKQSQNMKLIVECIDIVKLQIVCLAKKKKIDAIGIVPHSIQRTTQLLKILRKHLDDMNLPFVEIIKYYPNKIPVPQKSLKTREQRIRNAQETIVVYDKNIKKYKKVLLIDDFVGSGSTLNETAQKLKEQGVKDVIGFAFVGNTDLKFDVIQEI